MANRFLSNITINDSYTFPSADGDAGQIITTDGSGNLSFTDISNLAGAQSNFVYYDVKNSSGATINKGAAVMAVGTDGNSGHILIDEMVADGSIEPKFFMGVLESTLANGEIGRVIHFGELDQFNTNAFNDGDILWCDPATPGGFTTTEPDGPNVKIAAAIVINAATNGKIKVRVQGNAGLHELHDVKITTQANGDLLQWNNTTGVWENKTLASIADSRYVNVSGDTMTGTLTIITADDNKINLKTPSGDGSDWNYINFYGRDDVRDAYIGIDADGDLHLYSDKHSDGIFITDTGISTSSNLKINTNDSDGTDVGITLNRPSAGTHYHGFILATNGTVDWSVGQNSNDAFEVYENGAAATTRFTIKEGGNAGFGTTNPLGSINNDGIQIDRGGHTTVLIGDGFNDGGVIQSSDNSRRLFIGANIYDDDVNSWSHFEDTKGYAAYDAIASDDHGMIRIMVGRPDETGYAGDNIFFEAYKSDSDSYIKMRTHSTDDAMVISNNGNTSFAGSVTADSFSGNISGNTSVSGELDMNGNKIVLGTNDFIQGDYTAYQEGLFLNSGQDVAIRTNSNDAGTDYFYLLDSSSDTVNLKVQGDTGESYMRGSLGIGVTPSKKLHVYSSGNEVAYFQGTSGGAWIDIKSNLSNIWSLGAVNADAFGIYNRTTNSYAMQIQNNGDNFIQGKLAVGNNLRHDIGSLYVSDATSDVLVRFRNTTDGGHNTIRLQAANANGAQKYADIELDPDEEQLILRNPYDRSAPNLQVENNGNIGINTNDAYGQLTLTHTGNNNAGSFYGNLILNSTTDETWSRMRFDRSGVARYGFALNPYNQLAISNLYTNGTADDPDDSVFVIDNASRISIGSNTARAKVHIQSSGSAIPAAGAVMAESNLVVSGTDGNMDLLSGDDNSTVSNNLGFGRFSETTGDIIHKFGITSWANTGSQGSNTGDRLGFSYGTNSNIWTNSELFTIKANGKIGVNVTDPAERLDVNGTVKVTDIRVESGGGNSIRIGDGFGSGGTATIHNYNNDLYLQYNNGQTSTNLHLGGGGTQADLRLDTGGGAIVMNRNGKSGTAINIDHVENSCWPFLFYSSSVGNDNASGFWVNSDGTPDMRLRATDSTVKALISSNANSYLTGGSLGIFTTSPSSELDVNGNIERRGTQINPATVQRGDLEYRLLYSWDTSEGSIGSGTDLRTNTNPDGSYAVTALGRSSSNAAGFATITLPNRRKFRKVYGYFRLRGQGSMDSFNNASANIEQTFVDGVTISAKNSANTTHTHVWTIAVNNYNATEQLNNKPSFVGDNYQLFLTNHGINNTNYWDYWQNFNDPNGNPPVQTFYFEREMPSELDGDLLVRIMSDQVLGNEDVGIEAFALYIADDQPKLHFSAGNTGVRYGRKFAIDGRATLRLDSEATGDPADILFGHTAAANEDGWNGVYWSMSSRGSSDGNKLSIWRGSGNPTVSSEYRLMTFDPNNYVGIANNSPAKTLDVGGSFRCTSEADLAKINFEVGGYHGIRFRDDSNNNKWKWGHAKVANNFYLYDYSRSTSILTANASGSIYISAPNLGIGIDNAAHGLHIYKDQNQVAVFESPNANTWVDIKSTSGTWSLGSGAGGYLGIYRRDTVNTTKMAMYNDSARFYTSMTVAGSGAPSYALDVNGTIRATGDVIAYSDQRVKENISTIDNALDKVSKMRGVSFNKIGDDKKSVGVIAQEIEKILPEVVHEDEKGMKSVAYGNVVGVLIEAIKEQQKQIEELKNIINKK